MFDYLIIGTGFYGSICAYELNKHGYKVCVIDKRDHIGGNCYTEKKDNINIHTYGAHIFHTSNDEVWNWINQFVSFNNFINSPIAIYKGKMYSLPFNMNTFNQLWGVTHPHQAQLIIEQQSKHISEPKNLEEQAIKLVGTDVYEKLIKGYTAKQWGKDPKELPASIIKRLPVRFTYNNNYFNDKYQGIPIGGYTQIFEKLLYGMDVRLKVDYFKDKKYIPEYKKLIYTGPIDKFYNYQFGELEYKTVMFKHQKKNTDNWQGNAVVNFTDIDVDQTRILEHKHFENSDSPVTWITYEYPISYKAEISEPMYPVNDEINNDRYLKYKELANREENIIFGGRLAEYKYYDMHQVIESALNKIKQII